VAILEVAIMRPRREIWDSRLRKIASPMEPKNQPKNNSPKRKCSFDAVGPSKEMLDELDRIAPWIKQGEFVNLCIRIAAREAFSEMQKGLSRLEKAPGTGPEKSSKQKPAP
jgi:hypothetical protein